MKTLETIFDRIGYELVRLIAEGGMGSVYEGRQKGVDGFEKVVAIKVIKEEYSAIQQFRSNFVGEAKLVADLIHTNIVQTYHLGQHEMLYFMVMEYVNGVNLEDFMVRHMEVKQEVPVDLAVFLVSRVCRGLSYAHQKRNKAGKKLKLVHRDVCPRNIMLAFEGDVKLTDFGIAKARDLMYNKEGEVVAGKDEYLSPEQARKQVTDSRADIFSCGVILAELLLGKNMFEGDTGKETRENVIRCRLPDFCEESERIDEELEGILRKALEKDLGKRYKSAGEMLLDLEMYLYSDGYGPTNEKLGEYLRDIFKTGDATALKNWREGVGSTKTMAAFL